MVYPQNIDSIISIQAQRFEEEYEPMELLNDKGQLIKSVQLEEQLPMKLVFGVAFRDAKFVSMQDQSSRDSLMISFNGDVDLVDEEFGLKLMVDDSFKTVLGETSSSTRR